MNKTLKTISMLTIFASSFVLNGQPVQAANCSITNGVKVGDCADQNIKLDVRSSVTHHGLITGADIWSGGVLSLYGTSNGDIIVHQGGMLILNGEVNGMVSNQGGTVKVSGHVQFLDNRYGNVTLDGIADTTSGTIQFVKGAIANGKQM